MKDPDPEDFVEIMEMSDFSTIVSHMYRGEVQRANVWRQRLDRTTNWAILILSALITWTYTEPSRPHELLLFGVLFISILWFIEGRRFLSFNAYDSRIRVLEKNFIGKTLNPDKDVTSRQWLKTLADDLRRPHYKLPYWKALSHRLRRIYIWLFSVTLLLWLGKLFMHPFPTGDFTIMIMRSDIGGLPGPLVFSIIVSYYVMLVIIVVTTPQFEGKKYMVRSGREEIKEWEKKM
ncbi:MAG: DUF2270 domain-containing protein [Candidatus Saliniplasma sp.]